MPLDVPGYVSVLDFYQGEADYTEAFRKAIDSLQGGGIVLVPQGVFYAQQIVLKRNVIIEGLGVGATELAQSPGANCDFLISENFDALTGSGKTVATDGRVPSWFGIKDLRINGNGANQQQGRGIAWYGCAILMKGEVLVQNCFDDNVYTEYASTSGSGTWQGQEEGFIDKLTSMRSRQGWGWRNRGPHNSVVTSFIAGYNKAGGYISETQAGKFDGNVTEIGHLHTYANANGNGDAGAILGSTTAIAHWIIDGDYGRVTASNCQFGRIKLINGGQSNDGLNLVGNYNNVGSFHGSMYSGTEGYAVLKVSGNGNTFAVAKFFGQLGKHKGLIVSGSGNSLTNFYARECSVGIDVSGSLNTVSGKVLLSYVAGLNYQLPVDTHAGKNSLDLDIYSIQGAYITGDRPADQLDRFQIRATGLIASGRTNVELESAYFPLDTTAVQMISVPHGLLYVPTRKSVSLTLLGGLPADAVFVEVRMKVIDCNDEVIRIQIKVPQAAATGSVARLGVKVVI
ncbi:hypothetical protein [Pseudomonas oryzihabitans]|uniref:hypothetical protein n=1 Tax=Pseudomonas oryzihabitans TaxID=47885 RepID=UPI001122C43E|nr:hypothetical protein [Pseudomonas psychrotolerans]QDD89925.1 hypothetical protein CCZ28_13230 [Pseudomonas psychrotolerans]